MRLADKIGYREGIETGKLESLQQGFDDGYNTAGVRMGCAVGELKGKAAALLGATELGLIRTGASNVQQLREIIDELDNIDQTTLFEPDLDQVRHEEEHHGNGNIDAVVSKILTRHEACKRLLTDLHARLDALHVAIIAHSTSN